MKAVFKFTLYPGQTNCSMPVGAEPLCVQTQRNERCMWVLVDPLAVQTVRRFLVVGTGHNIHDPDRLRYIGTCQQHDGDLVWHVFEHSQSIYSPEQ